MSTIFDVAKLAGVSIKTVSRVANGELNVTDKTRAKVEAAIAQLQYSPHRGARMMRAQSSNVYGVITGAISSSRRRPYEVGLSSIHILRGIQSIMQDQGKMVMIADIGETNDDLETIIKTFVSHSVDGIIYVSNYHRQVTLPLHLKVPMVIANGFDAASTPSVVPDDYQGQYLATRYQIEHGHKKLGFVALNETLVAAQLRRQAFFDAARDHNLSEGSLIYRVGLDETLSDRFAPLASSLAEIIDANSVSSLSFGNDLLATRALNYFAEQNINIGSELSIIGFDNDIALCELVKPRLTTIELPYIEIGRRAAKTMLKIKEGAQTPILEKIPCQLVERESVFNLGS